MKVQRTRIALAVTLALTSSLMSAYAQQVDASSANPAGAAPDSAAATVVVTGIRASIEQSLKQKRNADSVMDVVSSEDIGKLPDKNVADAVERVPGVNISSGSGGQGGFSENDRVSIRGTNPSLTQTTVNGHSISTGDWYIGDQQGTVGRSVSFTLLPSEIVGSVEVQKSSQADFIEGGTAGNVNIVTRLPLDFKKQLTVEATAQALYADLPKKTTPQFNGLINWKNDSNTLGVLIQGFSEKRTERRDGQELFALGSGSIAPTATPSDGINAVIAAHTDLNGVAYPTQIGSAAFTQTSARTGGLFDVQMKPMTGLTLDVNGFYSRFHTDTFDTNFMASPFNELNAGVSPSTYTVKNGTLVAASFPQTPFDVTNPQLGSQPFPGVRDSIFRPGAGSSAGYLDFDAKYRVSDTLTLTSKIGYTKGVGQTPHDYGYEAYLINTPMNYVLNGNRGPATVSFPNLDTTNFNSPNVVNGGSWSGNATVVDQETYAQGDALLALDSGYFESAKFGVRFSDHKRSSYGINYACSSDPNAACNSNLAQFAPKPNWNGTQSPSNFGSGIGFGPGFIQNFWVLNVNDVAAWEQQYNGVNVGAALQNNFEIEEKDSAAYAMTNLVGEGWRGNVGLRLVNTKQTGMAYASDGNGGFNPVYSSHNYTDLLPSANLKFDLSKDLVGRLAASRTMSRPDYSSMSPAVVLNNLDLTGSGGNADLKAIKSNNFDAALEWYFAPQSILSAGLFYMDMPVYVGAGVTTGNYLNTSNQQMALYTINVPVNNSAKNEGLELAWQQSFGLGFGGLLNFTVANGHDADGLALVGASKDTGNLELFYENDKLSTRLAYTYRSEFLVGMANVSEQYMAGYGSVAASINYKINDNLTLTFDGLNLNNPTLKYYSNAEQPQSFYTNGRQFYLGVRMSM